MRLYFQPPAMPAPTAGIDHLLPDTTTMLFLDAARLVASNGQRE